MAVAGANRVVLGTDYPFDMGIGDPLARLDAATGLSPTDRAAIRGQTAAALLGLSPSSATTKRQRGAHDISPRAPAATFDHVGISVADLGSAAGGYRAALGLAREFEFEVPHVGLVA